MSRIENGVLLINNLMTLVDIYFVFNFIMRSTYCVYPCSSTEQISKSPINRSPTKQLYSFARDTRFRDPRP